ncbi:MAG: hypothetical protein WBG19_07475 [Thermoplasmata archaeon]
MLYQMGAGLQAKDFSDVATSNLFVEQLKRDLGSSQSTCVLCLLRVHAGHEETSLFSPLRKHDPDAVEIVMNEHGHLAKRIATVSATCDALVKISDSPHRIEVGDRLVREVNDLIAAYLHHMNNEEALLVPVMWEWFSDDQLASMRRELYDHLPLRVFETWMRWALPAMNEEELVILFKGLTAEPRSPRFNDWVRMAHSTLDLERWIVLRERAGVDYSADSGDQTPAGTPPGPGPGDRVDRFPGG